MIPGAFYIDGNVYDVSAVRDGNYLGKTPDEGKIARYEEEYRELSPATPFPCRYPVEPQPVMKEYKAILKSAGASLHRDDTDRRIVKEVKTGFDCGMVFEGFGDVMEDDSIEAYKMVEVPRTPKKSD